MKHSFSYILQNIKRMIVIHHTFLFEDIMSFLNDNDLIFFDDCLYSQYVFIQKNLNKLKTKNIYCVLGFSSKIFRQNNEIPIYEADCALFHSKVHNGDNDAFNAYMSINEIKELLEFDNIYLACHGAWHLDLKNMNLTKFQQMHAFNIDIQQAVVDLNKFKFTTNIFVFPYAYDLFPLAYNILKNNKFNFIFAGQKSKRIQIEDIIKFKNATN